MHTLDVHAPVRIPYFTAGDVVANTRTLTSRLPAGDVLFYGGLGALALAGALEWPVALAIGGATAVLRGRGKEEGMERQEEPGEKESTETKT
ncbi:hypothetical protein [Streptomyces poonensis]|nr:hypothetical protein [Streptomyces poonensis]